jgi:hypothetical protein
MNKILVILLVALAACGSQALKDQARDAMPSKDSVQMSSPQAASTSSPAQGNSIQQDSTAGDHSPFFDMTVGVSTLFNGGTAIMLGIVEAVTQTPPTSCTTDSCTWGPGHGALDYNDYKLVVTKNGDSFDWQLSGQSLAHPAGFVVFVSGNAVPGGQPHHGSGTFTVDFDKAATLDGPHDATGKLVVNHYSNVGPATLDVTYTGAKDSNPSHPAGTTDNIVYTYTNDTTGGGDLDFAVHNSLGDRFSAHSRWKNDGRGRADVAGLGSGYNISLSECWGAAPFQVVYFSSSLKIVAAPFGGPDSGAETQCAYAPAAFSGKSAP